MIRQRSHHPKGQRVAAGGAGQRQVGDGAMVDARNMIMISALCWVAHRMSHDALLPLFARWRIVAGRVPWFKRDCNKDPPMAPQSGPLMTLEEVNAFLLRDFPQIAPGREFIVEAVGPLSARMRLCASEKHLRPGGTISGPSMFALADVTLYVAILAQIGPVALAVTTNLNINFLRRPAPGDLIADCRLLKLGKRLAVGEVFLHSPGDEDPVAHATGTYSIPPG